MTILQKVKARTHPEEILHNWPDAEDIESDEREHYEFTDRFQKPAWFKEQPNE